ncbi:hypothetical protein [Ferruginibacter sp. HRS2-29]|uniref:hypothetical protein n=1 Tax=Ferruginibacter sp. HRS2-29 TaxID=2487334 RepID=UPI0020CBB2C0|nr:hypothetical protein [Ferruginibacter sp. HRS2-29]MCP9751394.1 hypothetical protein [Ferruginibacter sp. HRS2-29]
MQDILATYLFQHKHCPLPGIGSLIVKEHPAHVQPGERTITAPKPFIGLFRQDFSAAGLIRYIAVEKGTSEEEAQASLKQYCRNLKFMGAHEEIVLPSAGRFSVSQDGNILFSAEEMPPVYSLPVNAEKVIRPNDPHSMLVGDTETTNTVMTEFYSDEQGAPADRWWIWAIVLTVLAAAAIFFHYQGSGANGSGGNGQKVISQINFN